MSRRPLTPLVPLLLAVVIAGGTSSRGRSLDLNLDTVQNEAVGEVTYSLSTSPETRVLYYRSDGNAFVAELAVYGDGRLVYNKISARDGKTVLNSYESFLAPQDVDLAVRYCALAGLLEIDGPTLKEKYAGKLDHVVDGATVYLSLELDAYSGRVRQEFEPFSHTVVFHAPSAGWEYPELRALIEIGRELVRAAREGGGVD